MAEDLLAFTLFEEEGAFDKFTIALGNNYPEDYFSFQLLIKNKLTKNVFIFLPSRYKAFTSQPNYSAPQKQIVKSKPLAEAEVLIEEPLNPIEEVLADTQSEIAAETEVEEVIIESSEITTIWSLASQIAKETDADIYQIMWAIFLANEIAFIDNNINLVRADIDLVIPSNDVLSNISTQLAKDSIQQMNSTRQTLRVSKNIQSLLTLTAPIDNTQITPTPAVAPKEAIAQKDLPLPINKNQGDLSPDDFIQSNTKTIELGVDNEPLEALQETSKEVSNSSSIGILDMLLVSLAALLAGFIFGKWFGTFILIISDDDIYGFDNPADEGGIEGLPKGLSVKNDTDTQQLDLAATYIEMDNLDDAKQILTALVKSTDSDSVKAEAEALLLKTL